VTEAQCNGALGIFDPSAGQGCEIKVGPKSALQGVIQVLTDGKQNAIVRHCLGQPGAVWVPESGTDRLMVIRTARQSL